ncbi:MAG: Ada metal-binding domain-containing protein [Halopseudomonas sp.]
MSKIYKLLTPSGLVVESTTAGELGGNSKAKIYGKLDCPAANRALKNGYSSHRVFFADEQAAIESGYRPCGACMCVE